MDERSEIEHLRYNNQRLTEIVNTLKRENDIAFSTNKGLFEDNQLLKDAREQQDAEIFDLIESNLSRVNEIERLNAELADERNMNRDYYLMVNTKQMQIDELMKKLNDMKSAKETDFINSGYSIKISGYDQKNMFIMLENEYNRCVDIGDWKLSVKSAKSDEIVLTYKFHKYAIMLGNKSIRLWSEAAKLSQHRPPSDFIMFESQLLNKTANKALIWSTERMIETKETFTCFLYDENNNVSWRFSIQLDLFNQRMI
jgi:hypothetical protein